MAETFFIRLSDGDAATWGAFDAMGGLVGAVGRGNLESAQQALAARRCTAIVNAVDVLTSEATLPAASQTRLRQLVPFSLEESLADDIEHMVFAIGARLPSGATQVAAVAKERMDAWLQRLHAAGIVPHALCSETDGIPDIPATLVLVIEGERVSGRRPGHAPFVFEGLTLTQGLALVAPPAAEEPELRHVRVFTDAPGRTRFGSELALLDSRFASAEVKILGDVFPYLAATLAQRPGTNLLQGAYAPKSNWLALARPWRLAASLAAVAVALGLVLQGAEFWRLRRVDAALSDVVASACQRVVGDASVSGCQREIRQRLGSAAGGATEDFLSTLAAIASAHDDEMQIDALSYRNRVMDLQMLVPNVVALEDFSQALEQTRRFDVQIETANRRDDATEGRLRIAGANP